MVLNAEITEKSFGSKVLMSNIRLNVDDGEKIGVIGRNGIGKSTLFGLLTGADKDFSGEIIYRRGAVLASTQQEYSDVGEHNVLEFILNDLPEYSQLHH